MNWENTIVNSFDNKRLGEVSKVGSRWAIIGKGIFELWYLDNGNKVSVMVKGESYPSIKKMQGNEVWLQEGTYLIHSGENLKMEDVKNLKKPVTQKTPDTVEELLKTPMHEDVKNIKADYRGIIMKRAFENIELNKQIATTREFSDIVDEMRYAVEKLDRATSEKANWEGMELLRQIDMLKDEYVKKAQETGINWDKTVSKKASFESEWDLGDMGVAKELGILEGLDLKNEADRHIAAERLQEKIYRLKKAMKNLLG